MAIVDENEMGCNVKIRVTFSSVCVDTVTQCLGKFAIKMCDRKSTRIFVTVVFKASNANKCLSGKRYIKAI